MEQAIKEFVEQIKAGQIPVNVEQSLKLSGWYSLKNPRKARLYSRDIILQGRARSVCMENGMYAIVDQTWTKQLADWVGRRTVLEVMAGRGWLAKALTDHGIDILATDDESWAAKHATCKPLVDIEVLDAAAAAARYSARDILLMSWPPYTSSAAYEAIRAWGKDKPIVYIGECSGGCTADDEFFKHFKPCADMPKVGLPQWCGIHDRVFVGYYVP